MGELTSLLVDLIEQALLFIGGSFVHFIQLLLVLFKFDLEGSLLLLEGPFHFLDLILINVSFDRDLLVDKLSVLDLLLVLFHFYFALLQLLLESLVGLLHRLQLFLGVVVLLMDLIELVALLKERLLFFLKVMSLLVALRLKRL